MTQTTFYNCYFFDGTNDQNQTDTWFTVDDTGRITAIGHGTPTDTTDTVDLHGQYVMPGFINVHTHITSDPDAFSGHFGGSETESAVFDYENLRTLLKSGVTYIRECGTTYDIDIKLKRLQRQGKLPQTPHMMASGRAFSMMGGHGDGPHAAYLVDSQDEMRKAVRTAFKGGAECIKVMATGGVMTPNDFMEDPQLSTAEIAVAVEEAHHKRRIVAAHAEGNPGIQNALNAGVDSIEHGFYVNSDEAHQMVEQGTYLTPTLVAEAAVANQGQGQLPDWEVKKAADAMADTYLNLSQAFKIGVKFTCGTDAGTPFNGFERTPEEFGFLAKIGMTPAQAYQFSSINAATLMGIANDYGTLTVGKFADFQVLRADPLADTAAVIQADKAVYVGGVRQF